MSAFELLPAVDLRGGRVVRLRQGDFDRETAYSDDPVAVAAGFAELGAAWVHVVDLDGAREGRPMHESTIDAIVRAVSPDVQVEVSGGLRDAAAARSALERGASRIVVGTAALRDPTLVGDLVAEHGPTRIAVSIDVRNGNAVGEAWVEDSVSIDAGVVLERLADVGVTTFEVTAIDRDGSLSGPDFELFARLVQLGRGRVIASGGVRSVDDLRSIAALGCRGAIVGRALYEGRLDLAEALATVG